MKNNIPLNLDLLDLQAFLTVADFGSFVRAAKVLNVSQSALSRRVRKLEDQLGSPLLERSTRHVALTMVGREFAPKVRRLLDEFENSMLGIRDLGVHSTGQVSVATVPTALFYFLPRALVAFSASFPNIRVRILDLGANDGLEAVARGDVDFGVNFIGASHPDINFTPLMEDPFVVACRIDHVLAAREHVGWQDLAAHRVIIVDRRSGNRALIDDALSREGRHLRWSYEVAHLSGALGLVEAGIGVAILPALATPTHAHPLIRTLRLVGPEITRVIGITRRRSTSPSPLALKLLDILLDSAAPTFQLPRLTARLATADSF